MQDTSPWSEMPLPVLSLPILWRLEFCLQFQTAGKRQNTEEPTSATTPLFLRKQEVKWMKANMGPGACTAVPCLGKALAKTLALKSGKPRRLLLMKGLMNLACCSTEDSCSSSEATHHSTPRRSRVPIWINFTLNEICFKKPVPEHLHVLQYLWLEYHSSEQSLTSCFACHTLH